MSALRDLVEKASWEAHGAWASHKVWTQFVDDKTRVAAETRSVPAPGNPFYSQDAFEQERADATLIALAPDLALLVANLGEELRRIRDGQETLDEESAYTFAVAWHLRIAEIEERL